jgi:hypothetical protein
MRNLFGWLKARTKEEPTFDVAYESWGPVPITETGTDWGQWLQQEDPTHPKKRRNTIRQVLPVSDAPPVASETRSLAQSKGQAAGPPHEKQWVEVISSYGEHLTDEELRIIRSQLSK